MSNCQSSSRARNQTFSIILHISAHGTDGKLKLSKADRTSVELTGDTIRAFLHRESPPKLVYVNACDSQEVAGALVDRSLERPGVPVGFAIGTTAPITNRAARAAAALFYSRIFDGNSIAHAFEAGRELIKTIQNDTVSAVLRSSLGSPTEAFLYQKPLMLARFAAEGLRPRKTQKNRNDAQNARLKKRLFDLEYGFIGLPSSTTQVVLFTDDEDFLPDEFDDDELEYGEESATAAYICRVIRSRAVRGVLWSESGWRAYGDFRIAAVGITADGSVFAMSSMLCDAIRRYYTGEGWSAEKLMPEEVFSAIQQLKAFDGT